MYNIPLRLNTDHSTCTIINVSFYSLPVKTTLYRIYLQSYKMHFLETHKLFKVGPHSVLLPT